VRGYTTGTGRIRVVAISNPAAGADFTYTVPSGVRWRFISLECTFTTSSFSASRYPALRVSDGTNLLFTSTVAIGLTQSYGWTLCLTAGLVRLASTTGDQALGAPANLYLLPGFKVYSATGSIAAADQYSAIHMLVEEWS
jgi:hypothetical protein